ncbi:MAG: GNAT family N-acetyltransferase [Gammaproteobacteria bacterium]|nr:GNAT family N-acetyltransferase [Gammaproteobacteria bacterium]
MFTFREAHSGDAERIANLHAASWQRTFRGNFTDAYLDSDVFTERQEFWKTSLTHPGDNQRVIIAKSETALTGFLCVFGGEDPQWGSFIDNLHVNNIYQGQGVGSDLMIQASGWLQKYFNEYGVYLHVWESNPALHFYEQLGGRNTGLVEEENPDGGVGKYFRMVWDKPKFIIR